MRCPWCDCPCARPAFVTGYSTFCIHRRCPMFDKDEWDHFEKALGEAGRTHFNLDPIIEAVRYLADPTTLDFED